MIKKPSRIRSNKLLQQHASPHASAQITREPKPCNQPLLIEIATEELPAKSLVALEQHFASLLSQAFIEKGFSVGNMTHFSTPRRLAVCIADFPYKEPDVTIVKRGPSLVAAYDATGNPTPAALAFANSVNTPLEKLSIQETPKGKWLTCSTDTVGRSITVFLPEILTQVLDKLPMSKRMRWGDNAYTFLRPIQSITLLFGDTPIVGRVYGLTTQGNIRGHHTMHPAILPLASPMEYVTCLEKKGFVIAETTKRKQMIRDKIATVCHAQGMEAIIDEQLLAEVTGLVEYPEILVGHFKPEFLALPPEVLITAMQVHQRCFACQDKQGNLLPYFIIVSNLISKDSRTVIRGNERVMHARLQDAVFHFEQDKKISLSDHNLGLSRIVFQAGLGSVLEKTRRIMHLSHQMAHDLGMDKKSIQIAERAAELCKADLLTHMVSEFPELQGIMGKYYAQLSKENDAVAEAIEAHYLPRFAQDKLPSTSAGSIVSIADKIDSLIGLFGIGKAPTGDKDPFALRRQAAGILRICIENALDIDLRQLCHIARDSYGITFSDPKIVEKVVAFLAERLKTLCQEKQLPLSIFDALADKGISRPLDLWKRAQALALFLTHSSATSVIATNKRVKNILSKQTIPMIKGDTLGALTQHIDMTLLSDPSEKALIEALTTVSTTIDPLLVNANYDAILLELVALQKPVDDFFDSVMILDKNESIKMNRLRLLQCLQQTFNCVGNLGVL